MKPPLSFAVASTPRGGAALRDLLATNGVLLWANGTLLASSAELQKLHSLVLSAHLPEKERVVTYAELPGEVLATLPPEVLVLLAASRPATKKPIEPRPWDSPGRLAPAAPMKPEERRHYRQMAYKAYKIQAAIDHLLGLQDRMPDLADSFQPRIDELREKLRIAYEKKP